MKGEIIKAMSGGISGDKYIGREKAELNGANENKKSS